MREVLLPQLFALAIKLIGNAFQKEHTEDELLEFRGVHLTAQDVSGLEEEGFELGESDLIGFQWGLSIESGFEERYPSEQRVWSRSREKSSSGLGH